MTAPTIHDVLSAAAVRSEFQPIVDLDSGAVVAYEALARGPVGPLHRPDHLFAAAREAGVLAELDHACRAAALHGAVEHGLVAPLTLFVNVEPEILDSAPLTELVQLADGAPGGLRVVVEMTERALAARPAELLRTVERIREIGWGVALDDVGADAMSLAFMPLLRPDVVKLDLRLVQDRPGPAVAQIMNAVNAYAEESGALVLAEGIEDEKHLLMARALGARLGQGWLFGRPAAPPPAPVAVAALTLPPAVPTASLSASSPFAALTEGTPLRRAPKGLLIELSKQLEREALRLGDTCVVASTFQEAKHFTPATRSRYRDLAERVGFVCALGEGLPEVTVPGVRGATFAAGDPVRGEWDVVVLAPHFAAALLARDLGDDGPERERTFEYALTYERTTVAAAAHSLLARVAPRRAEVVPVAAPAPSASAPAPVAVAAVDPRAFLERALSATTSGVSIADVLRPDHPLVYVNSAFEELSGWRSEDVLGRNCRFLQGPDTDRATVDEVRAAIRDGREWRGVLLNVRGPERTPWWNEVHLAPVVDSSGRVVQYVGIQNDVTARVQAQRDLERERERSRAYVRRIEELASTDPLTGLANRRHVESALRTAEHATTLLFCDLDGFKVVNDELGHAAGDELLVEVARRLRAAAPADALLARLGGDEFLLALTGPDPDAVARRAAGLAGEVAARVADPFAAGGRQVSVGVSVGVAHGGPGESFEDLLRAADHAMYRVKNRRAQQQRLPVG
ncbi:EAL domain-containing protein [Kineococcus rhizosphaerae]|uniref:PAS domain S-box-containing protein/diguanylate cyclase (GGDEF)-like protein n=1 Tax=Kineococcus rhizosphaerae TaxID=559628 RepID=A0A2T0R291_9ACTN|nr:EAL domain-containing protein [Kineococcus rhizosphaerae]PRY13922.1 PAS domain S-box-containing protein/diguanylate cyclase (GGDEF)-like protein [Kineococcus rhizosphaerae]